MVAGIFIAVYPIGLVALITALLYLNRDVLGERTSGADHAGKWWSGDLETFSFLVDGYRREAFWCEICEPVLLLYSCLTLLTFAIGMRWWNSSGDHRQPIFADA